MMEIFSVGPDDVHSYELDRFSSDDIAYIVYWYEIYSYEGDGDCVVIHHDNSMEYFGMSHCSCYGPLEDSGVSITVEDIVSTKESIHEFDCKEEVKNKVKELLGL